MTRQDMMAKLGLMPADFGIKDTQTILTATVQAYLDAECQKLGYDNGFACASYATSTVPKFRAEAQAYIAWRDAVWSYCYAQLDLYNAGKRDIPTDIISELPPLDWEAEQ